MNSTLKGYETTTAAKTAQDIQTTGLNSLTTKMNN